MLMGSNCCYSINKVEALLLGGWSYFVKEGHNGVKYLLQDSYFFCKICILKGVYKVKNKNLDDSLDSIPSPSPSVKIQIMGGKGVKANNGG